MSGGIGRRLDGRRWNLSDKPTFSSVLLNDGWVAANDLKQHPKKNHPKVVLVFLGGPGRNLNTDTRILIHLII